MLHEKGKRVVFSFPFSSFCARYTAVCSPGHITRVRGAPSLNSDRQERCVPAGGDDGLARTMSESDSALIEVLTARMASFEANTSAVTTTSEFQVDVDPDFDILERPIDNRDNHVRFHSK